VPFPVFSPLRGDREFKSKIKGNGAWARRQEQIPPFGRNDKQRQRQQIPPFGRNDGTISESRLPLGAWVGEDVFAFFDCEDS